MLKKLNICAITLLFSLIVFCLLWEAKLAPVRPGGSWLMLKVIPLLFAVPGILKGRRYTCQWLPMLLLVYLLEGMVRIADAPPVKWMALTEIVLSALLFLVVLMYARLSAPSRLQNLLHPDPASGKARQ